MGGKLYKSFVCCPRNDEDDPDYLHPCSCPSASLITKSISKTATLCGFVELNNQISSPPKKYLRKEIVATSNHSEETASFACGKSTITDLSPYYSENGTVCNNLIGPGTSYCDFIDELEDCLFMTRSISWTAETYITKLTAQSISTSIQTYDPSNCTLSIESDFESNDGYIEIPSFDCDFSSNFIGTSNTNFETDSGGDSTYSFNSSTSLTTIFYNPISISTLGYRTFRLPNTFPPSIDNYQEKDCSIISTGDASRSSESITEATISAEDTEEAALERATEIKGTSNSSIYQVRSTGFSFTVRTVDFAVLLANLSVGTTYEGGVTLQSREAVVGVTDTLEDEDEISIPSFKATKKYQIIGGTLNVPEADFIENNYSTNASLYDLPEGEDVITPSTVLPNEQGYEYVISSPYIEKAL